MLVRMMSPHDDLPNQSRTTASFERETHNGRTRGVRVVADYQRDSTRQSCEMSRRPPFDLVVLSAGGRSIGAGGWARSCAFGITWSKTSCARVVSGEDRAATLPWRDRECARAEEIQRCENSSQRYQAPKRLG